MIVDRLFNMIDRGRDGKNIGISTQMPRLDGITYGVQREIIETIAADTGSTTNNY